VVQEFVQRFESLDYSVDALRIVCVEGDSVDDTAERLEAWAAVDRRVTVVTCDTGKARFGSVVDPERFSVLAQVFNAGLERVDLEWADYVMMLPADIFYEPDIVKRLVKRAEGVDVDVVCPLTWTLGPPNRMRFYDLWALSEAGRFFGPFSPEFAEARWGGRLAEMTTVGGTLLAKAAVLQAGVRYTEDEVDRGFSARARRLGYRLWLDSGASVYHP
jgi:hypothetical protein